MRDVNAYVFGKGLELLYANGDRFEINQLLQMIQHQCLTQRSCVYF